ncbi:MAG: DUF5681 domain-containing protein [Sphingobium sp.]
MSSSSRKPRRPYKEGNVDENGDYIVGDRRTPKLTRFVPGQSGNPVGRPKGARGMKTILRENLDKKQTIKVNGKERTKSRLDNMFETLTLRAGAGDLKAQAKIIELYLMLFGPDEEDAKRNTLSANDQRLLEDWLADMGAVGPQPEDTDATATDSPDGGGDERSGNEDDLSDGDEEGDDGAAD